MGDGHQNTADQDVRAHPFANTGEFPQYSQDAIQVFCEEGWEHRMDVSRGANQ